MTYTEAHNLLNEKARSKDPEQQKIADSITREIIQTKSLMRIYYEVVRVLSSGPVEYEDFFSILISLTALGAMLEREIRGTDTFIQFMNTLNAPETKQ